MRILAIETSCDETGVSIIEAKGGLTKPYFTVLANITASQIPLHNKYGGVFPMMAKREHSKNLAPILEQVLKESILWRDNLRLTTNDLQLKTKLQKILTREPELTEALIPLLQKIKKPKVDAIAVTYGPGLEPTLWVGINFAKALSLVWNIPIIPINHMEGHIFSALLAQEKSKTQNLKRKTLRDPLQVTSYKLQVPRFPTLALLISGGHTELVLMRDWFKYKIIGETRDDAVGEAFDKVARMLGLPYPGGPYISALAKISRKDTERTRKNAEKTFYSPVSSLRNSALSLRQSARQLVLGSSASKYKLPRPMLYSKDFDFSFSGLKTAVLYLIRNLTKNHSSVLQNTRMKQMIAREFEDAVVEVLAVKTLLALQKYKAKTLILGGGVAANEKIRQTIKKGVEINFPNCAVYLPQKTLTGDNAIMIAVAGYFRSKEKNKKARSEKSIRANGNLSL
ncbi:MAG: tRNA (adenosine(37)-N6)-threonylcarbamoyltransferase complex transferase subunit TsaD [Patescibacteria group bacterium]